MRVNSNIMPPIIVELIFLTVNFANGISEHTCRNAKTWSSTSPVPHVKPEQNHRFLQVVKLTHLSHNERKTKSRDCRIAPDVCAGLKKAIAEAAMKQTTCSEQIDAAS